MKLKCIIKKTSLLLVTYLFLLDNIFAVEHTTIGSFADHLLMGSDAVTRFIHFITIIVGIFLFVMAFSLFRAHWSNPKFVPLERPIIYLILGIVLVVLPYFKEIFLPSNGLNDLKKQEARAVGVQTHDIDAPLEWEDFDQ